MLSKLKFYQKLKCHQNWDVTNTELLPKLNCHQKWNVPKTEISPKWNVTITEMSPVLKCHEKWKCTKTEKSPELKCHQSFSLRSCLVCWFVVWLQCWADSNVTMAFEYAQVTKTEMSSKPEMSPKLIYHQNWNVICIVVWLVGRLL